MQWESKKKIAVVFGIFVTTSWILAGCSFGRKEVNCQDDMPTICGQELKNCFGEEYVLSEGVQKEEHFWNEFDSVNVITHYTEWELTYKDADGEECRFVFDNRTAGREPQELMAEDMETYFCDLVEQYYEQNFWSGTVAEIPGSREEESVLYFKPYQLFSIPEIPETSVMFDERNRYSLTENLYFPQFQYHRVFREFPYILDMYLDVTYGSADKKGRDRQCRETEARLREMLDGMIRYTDGSLNAKVHVIMLDENGYVDSFSVAVLNGEYFAGGADGLAIEYEKALHENFFGSISID